MIDSFVDAESPEPGPVEEELRIFHLEPTSGGWIYGGFYQAGEHFHLYRHRTGLRVISALHVIDTAEVGRNLEPQWCLSVTYKSKRPNARHVRQVHRMFDLEWSDSEEDNHEPGTSRKFWVEVDDHLRRRECECKDELTIVEPDGYEWQPALEKRDVPVVGFCRTRGDSPATGIHEQFVNPVPPHARR